MRPVFFANKLDRESAEYLCLFPASCEGFAVLHSASTETILDNVSRVPIVSLIRVMVVDDFAGWRQTIASILHEMPELQVISEVADGAEAVRIAEELKPDLVTLDVSLPNLNGIDAAIRISELAPETKILFVSQHDDPDIITAALNTGAPGYLRKINAKTELLSAVAAILLGGHFLSTEVG